VSIATIRAASARRSASLPPSWTLRCVASINSFKSARPIRYIRPGPPLMPGGRLARRFPCRIHIRTVAGMTCIVSATWSMVSCSSGFAALVGCWRVLSVIACRIVCCAERIFRKISMKVDALSDENSEALAADEPLLATLSGASVAHVGATGIRRGARSARVGSGISPNRAERTGRLCVVVEGFSLHAAVRIAANDRGGLEHLARYLARPPIATDRLSQLADGRVMLRFKRPFSDGTAAVLFTPFELIERLLPLVPRPRKHTIRFHGILAPAAGFRSKVVPAPPATQYPGSPVYGSHHRTASPG
jgi:putative transposase